MADMNCCIIVGRLTRDVELKYTSGGMAICNGSIACNRRVKKGDNYEDESSFFDFTLFGKQGEVLKQYLTKGKQIAIQGELKQDRWQQDGQNRSRISIIANNVQLLGGNSQNQQVNQVNEQVNAVNNVMGDGFQDPFPSDIPF